MKKSRKIVRPNGLKGRQITERMKALMNLNPINEDTKRSVIELTKKGPNGKAYAIVRESHEYYIKVADKTENLVFEDFDYIGGLKNKKDEVYPSYSEATKHLNLKFKSLGSALGISENINVLRNDNLLEHHPMNPEAALSATKGVGDADEYVVDKKGEELEYDADEDKETSGDNVADKKVDNEFEEVSVNESEAAIDRMITGEAEPAEPIKKEFSLVTALTEAEEDTDDTIEDILENLSDEDKEALFEALKKKV
jgi:hypothetical protein